MRVWFLIIAAMLLVTPGADGQEIGGSLRALLIEYRCPIVDRLERIYNFAPPLMTHRSNRLRMCQNT